MYINDKLTTYLNKDFYKFVINNQEEINSILQLDRNFLITYSTSTGGLLQ
jgi:hypothetical protein